jgi:polyisoprenoid-binding protein YceI
MSSLSFLVALASSFVLDVEPNHTTIGFSVSIVSGMTRVTGKFTRFEVVLTYDAENLSQWSVSAAIDAASIDTGIDERDNDLRGEAFFDTSDHPRIRFESDRIERRDEGYVAFGTITMRGVSRPLELPFRITAVDWEDGAPRLGVAAELQIDRTEFGIGTDWRHTLIPNFIGDEVEVEIFLWTRKGRPQP